MFEGNTVDGLWQINQPGKNRLLPFYLVMAIAAFTTQLFAGSIVSI
jgi:hypothetical protein